MERFRILSTKFTILYFCARASGDKGARLRRRRRGAVKTAVSRREKIFEFFTELSNYETLIEIKERKELWAVPALFLQPSAGTGVE